MKADPPETNRTTPEDDPQEGTGENPTYASLKQVRGEGASKPDPLVVGIGASAGGLKALKTFFDHVPEDSGLAFVVVIHLSPDHESHLAQLLQPHVKMPVQQVTETVPLEGNTVYVIPPNANLNTIDTHLRLSDLEERRHERAPIDHFFRTLADSHDGHSIGVILTGTGSDGTLGLKEIKEKGGLTIVQDPNEAEFDGMPQSAIATGLVDLILPLTEIPEAIHRIAAVAPRLPIPKDGSDIGPEERQILHKVFAQIRARTGRDFSRYKRSTILRRIRRRMQLRYVEEFDTYLNLLREEPSEVQALADDLLITVTNFFRDPEVYEALEQKVIPQLFDKKKADDELRVWSVGCATGEEAYSIAILLLEEAARREAAHELVPRLQIFASDLHEKSLAKAREGFYPGDIATDVSPERLQRFFHKEDGGYRIRNEVRELVVFAPHNLLGDPPFSRLDLISCRNVMIYLQRDVQRDVAELFHYALRPDGILVLGTSETIDGKDFFKAQDKRHCVWRKRNVPAPEPRLPVFPLTRPRIIGDPDSSEHDGEPVAYGPLHQRMVERYAPPSVLVSPDDNVVHFSEHAGRYLVHPGGEPTTSVFKLVHEVLRIELRSVLHAARDQQEAQHSKPLPVEFDGQERRVVLHARPALEPRQEGFVLVIFDERAPAEREPAEPRAQTDGEAQTEFDDMETKLGISRQRLQGIIEEYETSQEELKASNEELQSANEELRSTLEELETSKEELQSMNEELQTVNQENQHKVEELAQLSSDLQNLMAATEIATLFLDRDLRILRFTPRIGELFNVRPADRGRLLSDLTHRLGYDELQADARRVLDKLAPVEREVQDEAGRWYLTRVLPYRSTEDRIEGVVITFVDITTRKEVEEDLRQSEEQFRALVDASASMVWTTDAKGRVVEDSPSWRAFTGQTAKQRKGWGWLDAIHPDDRDQAEQTWREAVETRTPLVDRYRLYHAPSDEHHMTAFRAVPLDHPDGTTRSWVGMNIDESYRHEAEEALRQSEERYRLLVESATEYAIFMLDTDGCIVSWSQGAERIFGYEEEEVLGKPAALTFTEDDRLAGVPEQEMKTAFQTGQSADDRWHLRKDGERFWANGVMTALRNADGDFRGFAKVLRDNTERKKTEDELRWLNETLEARVREGSDQVRELASTLAMAEQDERRRIAQILHDDLQQLLFAIQLKMTFVRQGAEQADDALAEHAAESEGFLDRAIQVSRELTVDLSPPVLAGEGLTQTLAWLMTQMQEVHDLTVDLRAQQSFVIPQEGMRVLLFQIVRELLFNVVKHADTDRATVTLDKSDGGLIITVADEGAGFDPADLKPNTEGGFGLFSVRERLRLFGGSLEIESAPGEGTRMIATIPDVLSPPTDK